MTETQRLLLMGYYLIGMCVGVYLDAPRWSALLFLGLGAACFSIASRAHRHNGGGEL